VALASLLPAATTQLTVTGDVTTRAVLLLTGSAALLSSSPVSAAEDTQVELGSHHKKPHRSYVNSDETLSAHNNSSLLICIVFSEGVAHGDADVHAEPGAESFFVPSRYIKCIGRYRPCRRHGEVSTSA
jgi:hypothetical protein